MRCLVTGGSGFVGANLVKRLLADGHEVHLLLREGFQSWRITGVLKDCVIHICEIQDEEGVKSAVSGIHPEWVFHLAVYGAYPEQQGSVAMMEANVLGSINLIRACLGVGIGAYLNTGSSSEYGPKDHAPLESEALNPVSSYGVSKAIATKYCCMASLNDGLPCRTLRLYSAYGPLEQPTRFIPSILSCAAKGVWPPLARIDAAHDFVYVDDVIEAFLLAAKVEGQAKGAVYNIGSGTQTTLGQVVEEVDRLLKVPVTPVWGSLQARPWDTPIWRADPRLAEEALGWNARTSLRSGLTQTLEHLVG